MAGCALPPSSHTSSSASARALRVAASRGPLAVVPSGAAHARPSAVIAVSSRSRSGSPPWRASPMASCGASPFHGMSSAGTPSTRRAALALPSPLACPANTPGSTPSASARSWEAGTASSSPPPTL
eukprot:4623433-Pleurochrysis_carterae.AAC.2